MRFNKTTDYALRAMIEIAKADGQLSAKDVAKRTGINPDYTQKVLRLLTKSGFLASVQGRSGGFTLGRSSETISVKDIANVTEFNGQTTETTLPVLMGVFANIRKAADNYMESVLISDLI